MATGSKLGRDATKKLPGEGLQAPWPPLIKKNGCDGESEVGKTFQPVAADLKTLLLLEDNDERIVAFESVLRELGENWQMRVRRDAPTMLAECEESFDNTHLVSLDHDLNPQPGATRDPGT